MRDCAGCRSYRRELRGVTRQLAALAPAIGPLGVLAKLARLLGRRRRRRNRRRRHRRRRCRRRAAADWSLRRGGVALGAGHVATLIAAAVATAGGAVEIQHTISSRRQPAATRVHVAAKHRGAPRRAGRRAADPARPRTRPQPASRRRRPPRRPRAAVAQKAPDSAAASARNAIEARRCASHRLGDRRWRHGRDRDARRPATTDSTRDRTRRHDRSRRDRRRSDHGIRHLERRSSSTGDSTTSTGTGWNQLGDRQRPQRAAPVRHRLDHEHHATAPSVEHRLGREQRRRTGTSTGTELRFHRSGSTGSGSEHRLVAERRDGAAEVSRRAAADIDVGRGR